MKLGCLEEKGLFLFWFFWIMAPAGKVSGFHREGNDWWAYSLQNPFLSILCNVGFYCFFFHFCTILIVLILFYAIWWFLCLQGFIECRVYNCYVSGDCNVELNWVGEFITYVGRVCNIIFHLCLQVLQCRVAKWYNCYCGGNKFPSS